MISLSQTLNITTAIQAYLELKAKGIVAQKETYHVLLSLTAGLGEQGSGSYPIREIEPPSDLPSAEIVFTDMRSNQVVLNESCYTAMIRCYCQNHRVDSALTLFYEMIDERELQPKLRSFSSLFLALAENKDISTAFKLYGIMIHRFHLDPLEKDYLSLLRLCISHVDNRFYEVLDQMIEDILVPSSSAWDIFRQWFELGEVGYQVLESEVSSTGKVQATGQQLLSIELDDSTRAQLLSQIASFAAVRETSAPAKATATASKWATYETWLEEHQHRYNIILDGANIGYYKQNYAGAPSHVDYHQIDWLLTELQRLGYRPLLILHQRHTNTSNSKTVPQSYYQLIDGWRTQQILYESPSGCNDDWFWMYACVKLHCHIVTNDEMRDHHFQMLSPRWFARWKERHVVHFSFGKWKRRSDQQASVISEILAPHESTGSAPVQQEQPDSEELGDEPKMKRPRADREHSYREALCEFPAIYSHCMQIITATETGRKHYYFPARDKTTWLCALPPTQPQQSSEESSI
jgi:pentatricopeptide repeat protein